MASEIREVGTKTFFHKCSANFLTCVWVMKSRVHIVEKLHCFSGQTYMARFLPGCKITPLP